MKAFLLLPVILVYCACNDKADNRSVAEPAIHKDSIASKEISYGIYVADTPLLLSQWDSSFDFEKKLGVPLKRKVKQFDLNADTFSGSFSKELEFTGLKLTLFSPKTNGKTFWLQEIIVTDKKYKTIAGIGPGVDLETAKQAYPSLKKFPGNTENMYYVSDERYEKSIEMEFKENKLVMLRIYYMMN